MSALNVYDEFRMLGASPLGVPVSGRVHVNSVRPAVMLGRGVISRATTESSSGKTWYFFASCMKSACISLSLAGFFAARSSACDQSLRRSYSSHGYVRTSRGLASVTHGGRNTFVPAHQPSW